MSIWHPKIDYQDPRLLAYLEDLAKDTADQHLGIRVTEIGPDYLCGTVAVDERTRQPFGLLHGGISVVLAESLGSIGANLCIDSASHMCVGTDINATHLLAVREGTVTGRATPIRIGRSSQTWGIELRNADGKLTCVARLTLAVISRRR